MPHRDGVAPTSLHAVAKRNNSEETRAEMAKATVRLLVSAVHRSVAFFLFFFCLYFDLKCSALPERHFIDRLGSFPGPNVRERESATSVKKVSPTTLQKFSKHRIWEGAPKDGQKHTTQRIRDCSCKVSKKSDGWALGDLPIPPPQEVVICPGWLVMLEPPSIRP